MPTRGRQAPDDDPRFRAGPSPPPGAGPRADAPLIGSPAGGSRRRRQWHRSHDRVSPRGFASAVVVGFDGDPETLPGLLADRFPTGVGGLVDHPVGLPEPPVYGTDYRQGIRMLWPVDSDQIDAHLAAFDEIAPGGGAGFGERWIRPAVAGVALSPLLTWWALLFALSMLVRYEPPGWRAALDLDRSEIATPLQQLLEVAVIRVPELVLDALQPQ